MNAIVEILSLPKSRSIFLVACFRLKTRRIRVIPAWHSSLLSSFFVCCALWCSDVRRHLARSNALLRIRISRIAAAFKIGTRCPSWHENRTRKSTRSRSLFTVEAARTSSRTGSTSFSVCIFLLPRTHSGTCAESLEQAVDFDMSFEIIFLLVYHVSINIYVTWRERSIVLFLFELLLDLDTRQKSTMNTQLYLDVLLIYLPSPSGFIDRFEIDEEKRKLQTRSNIRAASCLTLENFLFNKWFVYPKGILRIDPTGEFSVPHARTNKNRNFEKGTGRWKKEQRREWETKRVT